MTRVRCDSREILVENDRFRKRFQPPNSSAGVSKAIPQEFSPGLFLFTFLGQNCAYLI